MRIDLKEVEEACKELYIRALKVLPPDIKQGFERLDPQRRRRPASGSRQTARRRWRSEPVAGAKSPGPVRIGRLESTGRRQARREPIAGSPLDSNHRRGRKSQSRLCPQGDGFGTSTSQGRVGQGSARSRVVESFGMDPRRPGKIRQALGATARPGPHQRRERRTGPARAGRSLAEPGLAAPRHEHARQRRAGR